MKAIIQKISLKKKTVNNMPELPEVEAVKSQLNSFLVGHKIEKVIVNTPQVIEGSVDNLVGGKVKKVRRFGKALSIDLDNGYSLVAHIKLTGQFIYRGPKLSSPKLSKKVTGGLGGKHTHMVFHLDKDAKLFYNDVRKFGWIKIIKTKNVESIKFIQNLGPEPMDGLTIEYFKEILGKTRRNIKTLLMDQAKIGGVGNIYANDALWLSRINPSCPASSLSEEEAEKLYKAVIKVLKEGIKRGGASELAFVTPDGGEGNYQKHFLAYGQQGKLCSQCKKVKIKKIMLSGRGTYFCPACQC